MSTENELDDFVYSLNEENYYEYEDIVDQINDGCIHGHEIKVYRGRRKDYKHEDFIAPIDIDFLIERMQESAYDNMSEFSEGYLDDLTEDNKKELMKLITDFLDSKVMVRFYGVDQIDEITITAGDE